MNIFDNPELINNKRTPKYITIYLIIIIPLFLIIFFILNIPYDKYKKFKMTLLNENIYEIYLLEEDIELFKNTLEYNKNKYQFKILTIDENYYFNQLRRIVISVNFEINIPNKIYEILIYEKETKIINEIFKEEI